MKQPVDISPDMLLDRIRARKNEGAAMRDLVGMDASDAMRRAVQRRLGKLESEGKITRKGERKGVRYFAVAAQAGGAGSTLDDIVPLSPDDRDLQRRIRAPLTSRRPATWNREIFAAYVPGKSAFLSASLRQQLSMTGDTGGGAQPAGTYARRILDRLLIDLSFNSSRLEGNTYSLLDTHALIERGSAASGRSPEEAVMILNHKAAIEFLVDGAGEAGFNRHTILNLHALLADNLLDAAMCGRLRAHGVAIGQSTYVPLVSPPQIEEAFDLLLAKASAIADPFEQSFFALLHLSWLQPFADVNKRVARLAANIPLIRKNLVPLSFVDVPAGLYAEAMLAWYEFNDAALLRTLFVWAYERSAGKYRAIQRALGGPDLFRARHRDALGRAVRQVILEGVPLSGARAALAAFAASDIAHADRTAFIQMAEAELAGLHAGNFARYRVTPSQFAAWFRKWRKP